jgi:hypothetical protein
LKTTIQRHDMYCRRMTGRFSPSTSITLPMLRHAWLSSIGCCGNMLRRIQMASSANTGRLLDRQQRADRRKLAQVAFRPEWGKHGRSAPFKHNDAMLDLLVFPCTGIQENLADKARKLGIPVMKHEGDA